MFWVVHLFILRKSLKLILWGGFLISTLSLNAQQLTDSYIPNSTIIYYTNFLSYLNPAGQILENRCSFNLKYASFTGIRKEINEIYADGLIKIGSEGKLATGIQLYNNNQGPHIHLINAKLLLRYKIPLNEKLSINPGIGFGLLNYNFEGNASTAGGSDIVPDMDIGASLQSKTLNIGIATQHLIDRNLQPIDAPSKKNQRINAYVSRDNKVSRDFNIKTMVAGIYNYKRGNVYFDIITETVYRKHYKLIFLLYHFNSLGYGISFENIQTPVGRLSFNFLYSNPVFRNNVLNSNRYEIGISYLF